MAAPLSMASPTAALDGNEAQCLGVARCTLNNNATRGCADRTAAVKGRVSDMLPRRQTRKTARSPGMSTGAKSAGRLGSSQDDRCVRGKDDASAEQVT